MKSDFTVNNETNNKNLSVSWYINNDSDRKISHTEYIF